MSARKLPLWYPRLDVPQFIDFADLGNSINGEVDLGQVGGFSPGFRNATATSNLPADRSSRNRARPRIKLTTPANQFSAVGYSCNTTDSEKLRISKSPLSNRLSKSDDFINVCSKNFKTANQDSNCFPLQHKRSLSESALRSKTKTYPTTPMCLKRTLCKTKTKKIKSSEELELEKIAELQKKMHEHLRANENTMRRLKLRARSCVPKELIKTEVKSKDLQVNVPKERKVLGSFVRKTISNCGPKEDVDKKNILTTKTERAAMVMNRLNKLKDNVSRQLPETSQSVKVNSNLIFGATSEASELNSIKNIFSKNNAHTGITLSANLQKSLALKSFNFTQRIKGFGPSSNYKTEKKIQTKGNFKIQNSNFMRTPCVKDKENSTSRNFYHTDVKTGRHIKKGVELQAAKISIEI